MQKAEGNDCFESDSTAHGYAIKMGALSAEYAGNTSCSTKQVSSGAVGAAR